MTKYWGETLSAVAFILVALYLGNLALEFPAGGGTFPLFAIGGSIVLSVIIILDAQWFRRAEMSKKITFDFSYAACRPAIITILSIVYVLAIFELGYFTASVLFLVLSSLLIGLRDYKAIFLTAVILFPLMFIFFELFLKASLPRGILI
jgi:hypothetical protein